MKRSDIHVANIHEYHIHDKVFKSLQVASEFFGVSVAVCGAVFRGANKPNQIIRDKLGVPDGIYVHTAAIHSYQIHNKEFSTLTEASNFFEMSVSRCSHVFRGAAVPTRFMMRTLGILDRIEGRAC